MADRFEELRTYVAIADAGGVNAAAAALGIAKSAASRRLSDLEARLGEKLVERSTRRFELTEFGRTFHTESRRILADLDRLEGHAVAGSTDAEELTVAVAPDLLPLVAPALTALREARPELALTIVNETESGDADITISVAGTEGRAIAETSRALVASPAYLAARGQPSRLSDLETHEGIVVNAPTERWTFARGAVGRPRAGLTVQDNAAALTMALAGAGIAQLPSHLCENAIEDGRLVRLLDRQKPRTGRVRITWTEGSRPAQALVDQIAKTSSHREP